ncbi:MAG: hypothetical protein NTW21_37375 [Verrucomicrobia bacterium]|nr:hypothetical protein [Verrucomicrobiota bacterium]
MARMSRPRRSTIIESDPATPEHKAAWEKFDAETESALKEGQAISTKTPGNLDGNPDASWMYNGRMHPVVPYALRGAIWNQCYSSMFEGIHYYHRMHSLIRGWREVWGQGEFPVNFHQLYAPGANDGLTLNDMGEMRLGFWLARDIPNVGMACQIDITGGIHYGDNKVEDMEDKIRLAVAGTDAAGGFAERAAAQHQLAVRAVGQVGFDPLAGEAVGDGFERAGERLAAELETADAVELGRGEDREWQQVGALALGGEHRHGDGVHGAVCRIPHHRRSDLHRHRRH